MLERLMQSYLEAFGKGWAPRDTFPPRENALRFGKIRRTPHAKIPATTGRQPRPHRVRLLRRGESLTDRYGT